MTPDKTKDATDLKETRVFQYTSTLFAHGLEMFKPPTDDGPGESANLGGGKLFRDIGFKTPTASVEFLQLDFGRAIQEQNCLLYTLSRVAMRGQTPVLASSRRQAPGSRPLYRRDNQGLLLYFAPYTGPNGEIITPTHDDVLAARDRIIECTPKFPDKDVPMIQGKIECAKELADAGCLAVKAIEKYNERIQEFDGSWADGPCMQLELALIISLPAGRRNSNCWWTNAARPGRRSGGQVTDQAMSAPTSPTDVPF